MNTTPRTTALCACDLSDMPIMHAITPKFCAYSSTWREGNGEKISGLCTRV